MLPLVYWFFINNLLKKIKHKQSHTQNATALQCTQLRQALALYQITEGPLPHVHRVCVYWALAVCWERETMFQTFRSLQEASITRTSSVRTDHLERGGVIQTLFLARCSMAFSRQARRHICLSDWPVQEWEPSSYWERCTIVCTTNRSVIRVHLRVTKSVCNSNSLRKPAGRKGRWEGQVPFSSDKQCLKKSLMARADQLPLLF